MELRAAIEALRKVHGQGAIELVTDHNMCVRITSGLLNGGKMAEPVLKPR